MFEEWVTGGPDNFPPSEDCTHIWDNVNCEDVFCWNDAPCTLTAISGDVLRPICKQEQTVWDHPYITSAYF